MKFKYPKKITMGDETFKVVWDKKNYDAEFSYSRRGQSAFIRIGIADVKQNPAGTLARIIHELKEIIHIEQSTRYNRPDEHKNYEFHYSHKEHTDLCARLANALAQFIK